MAQVTIERSAVSGGVISTWNVSGEVFHGVEQPWRDNLPYKSCIPTGVYALIPWVSFRHGPCFAFVGGTVALTEEDLAPPAVTRFACLVHVANYADQVEGCFGIGMSVGSRSSDGAPAVWNSADALARLRGTLGDDPYHIAHIRWEKQ